MRILETLANSAYGTRRMTISQKQPTIPFLAILLVATPLWAGPTVKDLAVTEAQKFDINGNGKIEGGEVSLMRGGFAKNPDGWLSYFNDNGDKQLDDGEIARIQLPLSKPKGEQAAAPKPGGQPPSAPDPAQRDRAFAEVRKHDANGNKRIEGPEVSALRTAFATSGKEALSYFDANRNRSLDDHEVAKIKW